MFYRFDGRQSVVETSDAYVSETAQVIGDVRIGDRCYIGHGAILRGDYGTIEIGDDSIVAEGAVVKREQKIPESVVVGGNPAKKIKDASEKEQEFWDYARRLYRDLARKYCEMGMERIKE